jgi:uncharacterized membrane protein
MDQAPRKPHPSAENSLLSPQGMVFILLITLVVVGWNYWLPTVEDYFNLQTKPPYPPNVDFLAYYRAGERFAQGQNPYYWGEPDLELGNYSDYLYPPTYLPFYRLLSTLDYDHARHVWLALCAFGFLTAFLSMTLMLDRDKRSTFLTTGLALMIGSYPLLLHIRNGQSDLLVISLVLLGLAAYWRGRCWIAALCFALATLLKVSPALFLITFVVFLADFGFLAVFLGLIAGAVVVSFLWVPPALYWNYLLSVLPEVSRGTSYWLNQSMLKFFGEDPLLAKGISASGFVAFTLFVWWLSARIHRETKRPGIDVGTSEFTPKAVFIMNLFVILIFIGKAWSMAYVWTILPAALLLTECIHHRVRLWYFFFVGSGIFLVSSKVYGYVVLDSLNLIGSVVMVFSLALWVLHPRRILREGVRKQL